MNSTRTVIAASLLVLLAAVACGSEAPEPVATAEPSATVAATPSPTVVLQMTEPNFRDKTIWTVLSHTTMWSSTISVSPTKRRALSMVLM